MLMRRAIWCLWAAAFPVYVFGPVAWPPPVPAHAAAAPPAGALDSAFASVHGDTAASVKLPDGRDLFVYGDTTQVAGVSTVSGYGYPHNSFAMWDGTSLTARPGPYGYGWQQIPNRADGSYFWPESAVVDSPYLDVFCTHMKGSSPDPVGLSVAVFSAGSSLAWIKTVDITTAVAWASAAPAKYGWQIAETENTATPRWGDTAWVPYGKLASPAAWQQRAAVISPALSGGNILSLFRTASGWSIYTKKGDAYGSGSIERLSAAKMPGPWSVAGTWDAPVPAGDVSYSVQAHPEMPAPAGQMAVSYSVNGAEADYHPLWLYLPR